MQLDESEPSFGQAGSSAGELLVETETFATGEFQVERVFDTGGERYPKINESLDFLAFFHKPHYAVVEVAPLEQLRAEPGRAPTPPEIDTTRQHQYVYMVRDLGARRQPAALITHRIDDGVLAAVLDDAPARPGGRREPQPTTGAGGLTRWASTCRSWRSSSSPSCSRALSFVASRLLAPRRPSAAKEAPYECGIVPSREPPERFPVSFYIVAMLFIMFDIEIVFLYPYAVERAHARRVRVLGDRRVLGDLLPDVRVRGRPRRPRLGAVARLPEPRADAAMVTSERTSSTTIRRVGTEGRVGVDAGGADTGEAA